MIIDEDEDEEENKFPYYIVRFKPKCAQLSLLVLEQFPYYIVRFKLTYIREAQVKCLVSILHSTI